jgi:MerR family transcriptional regulator, light-induced transcriptional regulator
MSPDKQSTPTSEAHGLTVAVVARRLGVAPATLRTWARRYGLGPSGHQAGLHRRYSEADVERLHELRRLLLEGFSPAEAALRLGSEEESAPQTPQRRQGGGRALALAELTDASPEQEQAARGLSRAALALDCSAARALLVSELRRSGVESTWSHVVTPVMIALGERWQNTGTGIDTEHALTEVVVDALSEIRRSLAQPINTAPVLLASAANEPHSLALHALSAALAEVEIDSRVLGARTPPEALADATRRTGPAALFIWSQLQETGGLEQLISLPTLRPAPRIVLGGPGWKRPTTDEIPGHQLLWVDSLGEAVAAIKASMGR